MNQCQFDNISSKFSQQISNRLDIDLSKLASGSREILQFFLRNRTVDASIFLSANFSEAFNAASDLIVAEPQSRLKIINVVAEIFGTASFIRWKKVRDFDADSREIFDRFVFPLVELELIGGRPSLDPDLPIGKEILYLPNVSPFVETVANGKSAKEFIYSYVKAFAVNKANARLSVGISAVNARDDFGALKFGSSFESEGLQGFYYKDFATLKKVINLSRPKIIIFDYFNYPWNMLPRLFPQIRFAYRSLGFNLFATINCNTIIGGKTDSSLPALGVYAQDRFQKIGSKLNVISIPRVIVSRAEVLRSGLNTRNTALARETLEIHADCVRLGTLCRSTKISHRFVQLVVKLLRAEARAIFFAAGQGVSGLRTMFPSEILDRVFLFEEVASEEVLDFFDIYLETFPEHQGMAIVEALGRRPIVVSLNSTDAKHILLKERVADCVADSEINYFELVRRLIRDNSFRVELREAQARVRRGIFGDPEDNWSAIEQRLIHSG
jgi:hypothetical protein